MEDLSQPWGLKRTLKYAVPLMLVGAFVVYAYLPHDAKLKVSAAKGGECIVVPDSPVTRTLRTRDCDRNHDGEIYAAFRNYPGDPGPGEPTPQENCLRMPEGLTPEETVLYERAIDLIVGSGHPLIVITNNEDQTAQRDYVCVVTFPERTGSFLEEVAAQVQPSTTTG